MECAEAIRQTAGQAAALAAAPPDGLRRIVVPVGSGMSLAGVLAGLGALDVPVLGVVAGADPAKRLDAYAPGWQQRATLVRSRLDYHTPAPVTRLGTVALDPVYEGKCLPYLRDGDLLWIVGIRASAVPPPPAVLVVPADGDPEAARFAAKLAQHYKAELGYIPVGAYRDTGPQRPARLYLARAGGAGGRAVGFLYAIRRKRDPALKIDRIARVPDAPKGTGRALFAQAVQLARAAGLPKIVLEVRRQNTNAIGFYRHLGCVTTGTKGENDVMELRLTPAVDGAPAA